MKNPIIIALNLLLISFNSLAQNLGEFNITNRLDGQFLRNDSRNTNGLLRTFEEDEFTKWTLFKTENGNYQLLNNGEALGLMKYQGAYRYEMIDRYNPNSEWRIVNHGKLGVSLQHVRTGLFPMKETLPDNQWTTIFHSNIVSNSYHFTWVFLSNEKHEPSPISTELSEGFYQVWITDPVYWERGRLSSKTKVKNTQYEPIVTKGMFGSRTHWKFEVVSEKEVRLYDKSWNQYLSVQEDHLALVGAGLTKGTIWELVKEGNEIVGLRNKMTQKYLGLGIDQKPILLNNNTGRIFLKKSDEDMTEFLFKNHCISLEKAYSLVPNESEIIASEQSKEKLTLKGDGFEFRRQLNESNRVIWWMGGTFGVCLESRKNHSDYLVHVGKDKYLKIPFTGGMIQISIDGGKTFENWKEASLKE